MPCFSLQAGVIAAKNATVTYLYLSTDCTGQVRKLSAVIIFVYTAVFSIKDFEISPGKSVRYFQVILGLCSVLYLNIISRIKFIIGHVVCFLGGKDQTFMYYTNKLLPFRV
jgi:hypothetical protein